ncbi:hypothetical protein EDD16DRAFT_1670733 [Pisolithus croceorrhizus]|nr:hypothetical protein EDD16DRAFT_1670733 [Pisolithus croceorrhizus]
MRLRSLGHLSCICSGFVRACVREDYECQLEIAWSIISCLRFARVRPMAGGQVAQCRLHLFPRRTSFRYCCEDSAIDNEITYPRTLFDRATRAEFMRLVGHGQGGCLS